MDPAEELNHLRGGAWPIPIDPDQADVLSVTGSIAPELLLGRCQQVLGIVLANSSSEWPELSRWERQLPEWFVAGCLDDALVQNCILDKWSLRGWLHWLRPENRRWYWWSALAGGSLEITLLVPERPYLRGALDWLLTLSGASEIRRV